MKTIPSVERFQDLSDRELRRTAADAAGLFKRNISDVLRQCLTESLNALEIEHVNRGIEWVHWGWQNRESKNVEDQEALR